MKGFIAEYIEPIASIVFLLLAALFNTASEYGRLRDAGLTPGKVQIAITWVGAFLIGYAADKAIWAWTADQDWATAAGITAALVGVEFMKKLALEVVYGVVNRKK